MYNIIYCLQEYLSLSLSLIQCKFFFFFFIIWWTYGWIFPSCCEKMWLPFSHSCKEIAPISEPIIPSFFQQLEKNKKIGQFVLHRIKKEKLHCIQKRERYSCQLYIILHASLKEKTQITHAIHSFLATNCYLQSYDKTMSIICFL